MAEGALHPLHAAGLLGADDYHEVRTALVGLQQAIYLELKDLDEQGGEPYLPAADYLTACGILL